MDWDLTVDSKTGCPDDYSELFTEYFPMMRAVVFRSGIAPEDVEDVAMDILARFIEKDGIAYYDPEKMHDVGESPDLPGARFRKAKFKGMLRGFTATYVMQYRDKQMTKHRREPWRMDEVLAVDDAGMEVTRGEGSFYAKEYLADTEVSVCIIKAMRQTREILIAKSTEKRNYGLFVDLCLEHGLLDGKINRKALREALGVSPSTLAAMLNDLREIMRPLLAEVGVVAVA